MKLRKLIKEYDQLPPFYGIAWWEFRSNIAICYPIPFNLLIRIIRDIWISICLIHRKVDMNPRDAYWEGYYDGMKSTRGE